MTSLQLTGVNRSFGDTTVLSALDLEVADGECLALLGESGSGKSTLLRLICGLDRADSGEIRVGDQVVSGPGTHVPAERRDVGMVFQDGALFGFLSVTRNVGFGLERAQRKGGPRVDEMLDLVGLSGLGDRDPDELSGGQRQRVALARALAPQPSVVLLDEPLSNLDAALRHRLRREIRRIISDLGITTIIVTHDRDEAFELGDRVAVLAGGSIVDVGSPEEIYENPASAVVAQATGDASFMKVTVLDGGVDSPWGRLSVSSPRVSPQTPAATRSPEARLLIRPEHLHLADPGDVARGPAIAVDARVETVTFEGSTTAVVAQLISGETVALRHLGPPSVARGDSIRIGRLDLPAALVPPPADASEQS